MTRESPFSPAKDDAMTGAPITMLPFSSVEMKGFPGPVSTRSVGGKTVTGGRRSPTGRKSVKLILPYRVRYVWFIECMLLDNGSLMIGDGSVETLPSVPSGTQVSAVITETIAAPTKGPVLTKKSKLDDVAFRVVFCVLT